MSAATQQRLRLIESTALDPTTRHLVFELAGAGKFGFQPGQHVCLTKTLEGQLVKRYYSIASAPNGNSRFELCVQAGADESAFGRFLARMRPGEQLDCQGPAGRFNLKTPLRDSIFLAAGTGISPIRSMLQYLIGDREDRSGGAELTLMYGSRDAARIYYGDEFERLQQRWSNFRFWPTLSCAGEDWRGRRGYVQSHLAEALRARVGGVHVYLCGPPAMIRQASDLLADAGFDKDSIIYEKYG